VAEEEEEEVEEGGGRRRRASPMQPAVPMRFCDRSHSPRHPHTAGLARIALKIAVSPFGRRPLPRSNSFVGIRSQQRRNAAKARTRVSPRP
jgi:hypothetical protein